MTDQLDITVRLASADDANLLTELGARTFEETFAADNTPEDMAAYLGASFNVAQQTAELADPDSTFLIAEVGGVGAGYAKLKKGQPAEGIEGTKPIELVRLYVDRKWFGRGVGEALMRSCLEEAGRAGFKTLWLGVWERNLRAQAFYRKWEFRAVGKHVFQLGEDAQTDILMEREI
ncbi:MAG TPA: GNAT family N-acetyltransferase [Pyrinomonadaceae bacterium]|jgi:ribosomal protein S18 acetylase RimI-like enzyme